MGYHEPFVGPKLIEPVTPFFLNHNCHIEIPTGSWIGFCNAIVVTRTPRRLHLDQKSAIWIVPAFEPSCSTVTGYLFAGAFSGWERAFKWCKAQGINRPMFSYAIDSDPSVGKVWAKNSDAKVVQGLIPLNFKADVSNVMFNVSVQSKSWFNVNRFGVNLIFSASPPCQSWSMGGKQTGLHSENGIAFIECINSALWVRPVALLLECSDRVPSHKHYEVIKQCLCFAGFKHHWSKVIPLDGLTGMVRTRWLGVWLRGDIFPKDVPPPINLSHVSPHFWNDEECNFYIPESIKHQLGLIDELLGIYGDVNFLPPNKRHELGQDHSMQKVLQSRCLSSKDKMPTLCARYSKQHELCRSHLDDKGIYASLMMKEGRFMFFDPLRFVHLLGNPKDQLCVLSNRIDDAFLHLGNAISVQHALLAIKIALLACGFERSPIVETVLTSWQFRMTSDDVVILSRSDSIAMVPIALVKDEIDLKGVSDCVDDNIKIEIGSRTAYIPKQCSFHDLFHQVGIHDPKTQGIKILTGHDAIEYNSIMVDLAGRDIVVKKDDCEIFRLIIPFELVHPTQPWNCDENPKDEIDDEALIKHVIGSETVLGAQNQGMQKVGYFILGNDMINFISTPSHLNELEIVVSILQSIGCSVSPDQILWFFSESVQQVKGCRVCALDVSSVCKHPNKCIFVQPACDVIYPIVVSSEISPVMIAQRCNIKASTVFMNQKHIACDKIVKIENGNVFFFQNDGTSHESNEESDLKRQKIDSGNHVENPAGLSRIKLMDEYGPKLGTDEMSFFIRLIQNDSMNSQIDIGNVWISNGSIDSHVYFKLSKFVHEHNENKYFVWPVLVANHWGAIEVRFEGQGLVLRVINLNSDHGNRVVGCILKSFPSIRRILHFVIPAKDGFCGWALLSKWCQSAGVTIPEPTANAMQSHIENSLGNDLLWGKVSTFALKTRCFFMNQIKHENLKQDVMFGGAEAEDTKMEGANPDQKDKPTDPWLKYDPWANKQKQCHWEDLSLPDDPPFHDTSDQRIPQVHRHALNANNNGIAFCTRAAVPDILMKQPKQPFALVVPASDKVVWQPPAGATASDPQELIVQDGSTGNVYKRQVIIVQTDKQVQVMMPKPGFSTTLTEKYEVVLEVHTNLIPKDSQQTLVDKQLDVLKSRAYEQFPALQRENATIYGFRKIQDMTNKEKIMYQTMCKVTKDTRIRMLETSGAGDIFARDFISKGMHPTDTTIIPKFWACDRQGKDEALRSSATIDGFAGIVVRRRGIATRSWSNRISNVRKVLLASDERINDLNCAVVPHYMYNSTGWPLSIGPGDIVRVMKETCGLPPVPTRCFKILGVTTWTLGFDTVPSKLKFTAQFNGHIHEILMTKVDDEYPNRRQGKGNPSRLQGPKSSKGPIDQKTVPVSNGSDERLTSLETKVAAMERRQDGMEQKLQTGFDGIQNLPAVQPRPVSPRSTGCTPPSKLAKPSV